MIKWIFAVILVVWACLLIRRGWRAAGVEVDARRANLNPYLRRDDP